jgi:hypothetical protein
VLAVAGAAALVAVVERAGGDLAGWPLWQAIAVPAALVLVPAVVTAAVARGGFLESVAWAVACAGLEFALVVGVGFTVLGYGPG